MLKIKNLNALRYKYFMLSRDGNGPGMWDSALYSIYLQDVPAGEYNIEVSSSGCFVFLAEGGKKLSLEHQF
jgi:hypothetical protein